MVSVNDGELTVYLDGDFLPLKEARIPVMDRGFLFGDGVYEMIPVYGDTVFRLEQHLQRLARSLDAIDIPDPHTRDEWTSLVRELLERNGIPGDKSVYIEVTRGVGDRDHLYDSGELVPTVFMLCRPIRAGHHSGGVGAITHPDIRWDYCHIKAISLLPAVLLKNRASRAGCHEAILIRNGRVTEGASSNVFVVTGGVVTTPPKGNDLLSGITRDLVVELLSGAGIGYEEADVRAEDLRVAEEIWITSSTMEIVPVVRLDGENVGEGRPGPLWKRARELYDAYKQEIAARVPT